jgi:hypothetical protein
VPRSVYLDPTLSVLWADTLDQLTKLLDLKQKQANAWEARFSREGSQASQRQGNVCVHAVHPAVSPHTPSRVVTTDMMELPKPDHHGFHNGHHFLRKPLPCGDDDVVGCSAYMALP